jgi:hypothetical protein
MENEPSEERHRCHGRNDARFVRIGADGRDDALAEGVAEPYEERTPHGSAHERQRREYRVRHPENSGRNRNEVTHYRDEAAEKGVEFVVLIEKRFGFLVFFFLDEKVFAVFFDERFADVLTKQVVGGRSEKASRASGENREVRIEFSRGGHVSRRNHHEFRRNREKTGFERHQKEYPSVRKTAEGVDNGFYELCEQGRFRLFKYGTTALRTRRSKSEP